MWRLLTMAAVTAIVAALYGRGRPHPGWQWWPASWLVPVFDGVAGLAGAALRSTERSRRTDSHRVRRIDGGA